MAASAAPRRWLPTAGALLLLLLIVGVAAWRSRAGGAVQPLPHVRSVVLLLAPGASLADWQPHTTDGRIALALTPTRAGKREAANSSDALATAVETLAFGSREPTQGALSLADAVRAGGRQVRVLNGGAALAWLAPDGAVTDAFRLPESAAPFGVATDRKALADAALRTANPATSPALTVAIYDDVLRAEDEGTLCLPPTADTLRHDAVDGLNLLVADLVAGMPRDSALLVVTPTPSVDATARRERVAPALLYVPAGLGAASDTPLLLASPSTRRVPGLLPNTDIAATITALLDLPDTDRRVGAGRPAVLVPSPGDPPAYLARRAVGWAAQAREQRLLVGVPWALAVLLLVSAWRGGRGREKFAGACAVAALAVPLLLLVAAPLVPTGTDSAWALFALTAVGAAGVGLLAAGTSSANAARFLTGATALTLLLDTLLGGPLLGRSPLSYSVLEGARFYGIGNEASGLLLGSALLSVAVLSNGAVAAVLIAGIAVALASGLPMLGADAGGLIADLIGFGALAGIVRGSQNAGRRKLVVGVAGAVVVLLLLVALYAFWDAGRGVGTRTHVGEAVATARTQGAGAVGAIVLRKAEVNARLLVTSPWAALLAAEVGLLLYVRRRRNVSLTGGERAALWGASALFLLNDSGVVAAATCLLYPVGALLARTAAAATEPGETVL